MPSACLPRCALRAAVVAISLATIPVATQANERGPTVFAAASLKNALDAIASDWQEKTGERPVISYAATSSLAKQIEQGADADIFVSADLAWLDYLAEQKLVVRDSRFNLLGNQLVLIALADSDLTATIAPGFPLAELVGDGHLSVAGVDAVPAGKYAKAALKTLGVWDQVEDKLAQAENVRAALRLVSRGETQLGIVYASDAEADPGVRVLGVFPEGSHPPIIYPAAKLKTSKAQGTEAFLEYLQSPQARRRFEQHGFAAIGAP